MKWFSLFLFSLVICRFAMGADFEDHLEPYSVEEEMVVLQKKIGIKFEVDPESNLTTEQVKEQLGHFRRWVSIQEMSPVMFKRAFPYGYKVVITDKKGKKFGDRGQFPLNGNAEDLVFHLRTEFPKIGSFEARENSERYEAADFQINEMVNELASYGIKVQAPDYLLEGDDVIRRNTVYKDQRELLSILLEIHKDFIVKKKISGKFGPNGEPLRVVTIRKAGIGSSDDYTYTGHFLSSLTRSDLLALTDGMIDARIKELKNNDVMASVWNGRRGLYDRTPSSRKTGRAPAIVIRD